MATTTPTGGRRSNEARRAQLLELGLKLFSRTSYDDISIDEIARTAGVSNGLLYHYFGNKRGFFMATIQYVATGLLEAIAPDWKQPPSELIRTGLDAYLGYVSGRAHGYAALLHGGLGADPDALAVVNQTREAVVNLMLQGLGLATPRPAFRIALRGWVGAVEAACLQWLEKRDLSHDQLKEILLGSLAGHVEAAAQVDPDAGVDVSTILEDTE